MFSRLLVANRGEIAVRIVRAAHDLGLEAVAVAPSDDPGGRHTRLAERVAALPGTGPVDDHPTVLLKAVAGGGGRGIRAVTSPDGLDDAWERARSEAERAFGDGRLYVEAVLPHARHVEVQVLGDGRGRVVDLGERDCSLQRRRQKLIEIAPCPSLDPSTRDLLRADARHIAAHIGLAGAATIEFLVSDGGRYTFLEANPRLQVEHTVTEELTGVDLVVEQLRIVAGGALPDPPAPTGVALQLRVNTERALADGTPVAQTGTISGLGLPAGPGVRVDTAAEIGTHVTGAFDPLLAKIVVRAGDLGSLLARARRALGETRVDGVGTNLAVLSALLDRPEIGTAAATTTFVDETLAELVPADTPSDATTVSGPSGGTVVGVSVAVGDRVTRGQELAVLEAMKMEHVVTAPAAGVVERVDVAVGELVAAGARIVVLRPDDGVDSAVDGSAVGRRPDPAEVPAGRADLAEVLDRRADTLDGRRADAVARRHATGSRTARENVAALVDPGTFREYGGLAVAAQRARRPLDELRRRTPADGVVTGFGTVNSDHFGPEVARSHLGVGGPSMIEGGRLGTYRPDEIGPMSVQGPNGVVDVLVDDEASATDVARRYLSYFQGTSAEWTAPDQTRLRGLVPENRVRAYDVRGVIDTLADDGSVLELRRGFGRGMVTALARVEGVPLGIVANAPDHLGGAIDTDGADKAARFLRLCDAFDVPVLMLCDTPGMMVGPATVRRMGRLFVTGANLTTPLLTIVLRKAYGIGAELMAGGWFRAPRFVVAWPTAEFGGMNIEGNVALAHRAELDALPDPAARRARFDELVAAMHETGKALSVATQFEVDDVIDPAESRRWIADALATHRPQRPRATKKLPFVDPW